MMRNMTIIAHDICYIKSSFEKLFCWSVIRPIQRNFSSFVVINNRKPQLKNHTGFKDIGRGLTYFSVLPKLVNSVEISYCKLYSQYDYKHFIYLSNIYLVFSSTFHTTCQTFIIPSGHRRKKNKFENEYGSLLQKQKKRNDSPLILLLDPSEKVEVMTLDSANKLATKNNLKLVKIEDPKKVVDDGRPVYQLMTGKQHHEELMKLKERKDKDAAVGFKGEKAVVLTSKIGAHDLETKIKQMVQWLQKNFQIKVTITGSDKSSDDQYDDVVSKIEERMQECGGRVLQKTVKSSYFKCFINPPKDFTKRKSTKQVADDLTSSPS